MTAKLLSMRPRGADAPVAWELHAMPLSDGRLVVVTVDMGATPRPVVVGMEVVEPDEPVTGLIPGVTLTLQRPATKPPRGWLAGWLRRRG